MPFTKGHTINVGRKLGPFSEEHRHRLSQANKGKPSPHRGYVHSEQSKANMSIAHKGQKAWNKGKKNPKIWGNKHPAWKGTEVGYHALHAWVSRHLGSPSTCEHCGKSDLASYNIQWANKSGKYMRRLDDWIRLCVFCHRKYDKELSKI